MSISDIFEPTFDRLLLRPDPAPDLGFGLIRPDAVVLTRPRTGRIARLGPDCGSQLRVGQRVMHLPYDGKDMTLAGETVVHLNQESLLGVFQEGDGMIENTFEPMWDNLLVKDDEIPERMKNGIERPGTTILDRPRSGLVRKVGGQVGDYHPGERVIYGASAGCDVQRAGEVAPERGYRVISQLAILASLDGKEDVSDYMGESWKDHLIPCPGRILTRRAEHPKNIGRIEVPIRLRLSSRSQEAEVVAVSDTVTSFVVGERVFLAGSAAKNIPLGWREDVVIWSSFPTEITGRLISSPSVPIDVEEYQHLAAKEELARAARDTSAFEEGDTRAPR